MTARNVLGDLNLEATQLDILTKLGVGVAVSNFPGDQKVHDDYQAGECLEDQLGTNAVLIFTFSTAVQLVVVESSGADLVCRADPFGGTPTASKGFRCSDGAAVYIPVATSEVQVYAPAGTTVAVNGYRRA